MTWLSEMEYPHWMMVAGAVLVVVGFIGLWISRNRNLEPAEDNLLPAASPNFSVAGRAEGEAMSIVTDLLDDRGQGEGSFLMTDASLPSEFISEDDLNTFEGYLRLQGVDPLTATPDELAMFRQCFDEAMAAMSTTPTLGAMKFRPTPGEFRYGVGVREGPNLWLTTWVKRAPKGDVYVLMPRSDGDWNPHASYHHDGTAHSKSFNHKWSSSKKQPLTEAFKGCEHLGMFAGHSPKSIGAICDPIMFSGVIEVPSGILGPRDGFIAVDLVEPGCDPIELYNPVTLTQVFKESVPWIVIRVGTQARPAG